MNIKKQLAEKNNCYLYGHLMTPTGIVVHSIGCEQPNAKVFANGWNVAKPGGQCVCVHAFISGTEQQTVYQLLPWNYRCWGCGSGRKGSYNNDHIQFEICEPDSDAYVNGFITNKYDANKFKDYFDNIYKTSVSLCVELVKQHPTIKIENIVSHSEACKLGYASNHGDVEHWWSYHKVTMNDFRNSVREALKNNNIVINQDITVPTVVGNFSVGDLVTMKSNAVQYTLKVIPNSYKSKTYKIKEIKGDRTVLEINGVIMYVVSTNYLTKVNSQPVIVVTPTNNEFKIKVNCDDLNIRAGAGTGFNITGCIKDKGIYTITEIDSSGHWGHLKSGAGWVHLGYTTKI